MITVVATPGAWVYVFIGTDRHCDPKISLHATRESADKEVDAWKASYVGRMDPPYVWTDEDTTHKKNAWGHGLPWIRYARTDSDDGPTARIEPKPVGE